MQDNKTISVICTNYKGKMAIRHIIPKGIYFGHTEYHPEDQWLITAYDVDKQADRTFAMKNIEAWFVDERPLTITELKDMVGQPVYCPEMNAYGIVTCEEEGFWANVPFLVGAWQVEGVAVKFEYNIQERNLACYRVGTDISKIFS